MRFLLLVLVLASSARAMPAPPPNAHAQLDEILHRPMYSAWRGREEIEPPAADDEHTSRWLDRSLRYLSDKITEFWDWLFPENNSGNQSGHYSSSGFLPEFLKIAAWVITIAGLGFILLLIIQILRSANTQGVAANILSRQQVRQAMEAGDALALNSAQWMDEAQRLAADQNFRMVYRALYLALLSGLHSAGKIDHNPNRTNWTYVQNYRGPIPERDLFGQLTDLFDRIWYGHKNADSRRLPELREHVRRLVGSGGLG